jgi:hypothetical protein
MNETVVPQFQTEDQGLIWVPHLSFPLREVDTAHPPPSQILAVPEFQTDALPTERNVCHPLRE